MAKKGDTLIEVTIAIGIFSMIAVAIVAVMSNGTSGAQTALETTLTREEIDTQAEALRFIQTAYAVNTSNAESNKYAALWGEITKNAIEIDGWDSETQSEVLQYQPSECSELYDSTNNPYYAKAFVIDPRTLGTFSSSTIDSVYISDKAKFREAAIYPRLIYKTDEVDDADNLVGSNSGVLSAAEGIYVVAIKDPRTTTVFDGSGTKKSSTFYDFFIRSCWYGSNAEEPSTISTVIRLYEPTAVSIVNKKESSDDSTDDTGNAENSGDAYTGKKATYHKGSSKTLTLHHAADNMTDEFPQFVFIGMTELQPICWGMNTSDYSDYKLEIDSSCLESFAVGEYKLVLSYDSWTDEGWTLTIK